MPNRPRFSLHQLESIMDAVASGVVVCAPDGKVLAMNRAALTLHGMANWDEIVQRGGDFGSVFETTLADGSAVGPDRWPSLVAARTGRVEVAELQLRRRETGLAFVGAYTATPTLDSKGSASLVIVSIQDVSAARSASDALNQNDRPVRGRSQSAAAPRRLTSHTG